MLTITVTIGRNIKNIPMSIEHWNSFQSDIKRMVFKELFVDAENRGEWQGIQEESRVFVGTTTLNIKQVESILKTAAKEYQQDAIGLIVNSRKTSLVSA
jgi:hypothetical protein